MPSVAQLAGILALVAQAGTPWAETAPAPSEGGDGQAFFSGAGHPAGDRGQVSRKSAAGLWNGTAPPSSSNPVEIIPKHPSRGVGAAPGSGLGDGSRHGATPLAPPGAEKKQATGQGPRVLAAPASLLKVAGALGLVLGLFLIVAWGLRRGGRTNPPPLPSEVLEVLGRTVLAGRQHVHLIRLGRKLILVSLTPAGIETLSEVTEPEEVDRLAGLCRQAMPGSATAAFREVLQQVVGKGGGKAA